MYTSKFAQIRNSMHTYSRAPLAKGQRWIDQCTAPAGHNVYFDRIRAEEIPEILTIEDRAAYLVNAGEKYVISANCPGNKDYTKVLKFIDHAKIAPILNTNNESYIVVDESNNPITGFIDPADKPKNQYTLSEGYTVRLFAADGVTEITRNYGWTFDSFNGIITFKSDCYPGGPNWPVEFGEPTIEGIVYIGKYVSDILDEYKNSIQEISEATQNSDDNSMIIKPFKFTTSNMTALGEPYAVDDQDPNYINYYQLMSIVIPAYVFEVTMLDKDTTILTELRHLPNGYTQILIDIPWDVRYSRPIIRFDYEGGNSAIGARIPVIGAYKFMATSFMNKDGSTIMVASVKDYENDPNDVIATPSQYEYYEEYQDGEQAPYSQHALPAQSTMGHNPMPPHTYSDDDIVVNNFFH